MKKVFILLFVILSTASFAQDVQKIGYADFDYIFTQLPEYKQIDNEVKTHGEQLQAQLKAKNTELETKYKAYQAAVATMVDAIRKDKEAELTQLQENIQKFQQDAQASLAKKQNDLLTPVFAKIKKTIIDVAKENGYNFIINPQVSGGGDILLYNDEKFNISTLVLKKMGVTPAVTPVTPPKK